MSDCIFCKIIAGQIPCSKVYEDEDFIAFLDIAPANKGHTLVVPKKHYGSLLDAPEELAASMMRIAHKIAKAVKKATDTEGMNIQININKVAGQLVPHLHLHIIPRSKEDDFTLDWTHKKYEEGEMDTYRENIEKSL